jgi:hypothetical protein
MRSDCIYSVNVSTRVCPGVFQTIYRFYTTLYRKFRFWLSPRYLNCNYGLTASREINRPCSKITWRGWTQPL